MTVLLLAGGICLYFWQDMYTGLFWGIFFAFIKDILNIKESEPKITKIDTETESVIDEFFPKK